MAQKKLFLLDAMALIYRAYYAFIKNPRINSKGLNTSAMIGFTNTLWDIIQKEKPTHIGVAFDTMGPTVRDEGDLIDYKGTREKMPEDLAASIPYIKRIIKAFNIPELFVEGYEADDVIGTLSKEAEKKGFVTYMMTPDKDFGQLVSENIFMYKPPRGGNPPEIMGVEEVCKKFEIKRVDQVIDMLGLWGDAVDNIPGIPGVGEKTAKILIAEYDNVENVIANADKLKGKLADKVRDNAELALQSKELATIITDVPIPFDPEDLKLIDPNKKELTELFEELEFRALTKRILGQELQHSFKSNNGNSTQGDLFATINSEEEPEEELEKVELKSIETVKHNYTLCDDLTKRNKLIKDLLKQKSFCFDTETTGLDANEAELVGIAFSFKGREGYYVPTPENKKERNAILDEFRPVFENEKSEKVGQNIKYDIMVLAWHGVQVKGPIFDTMLAHYLIEPDQRHNMDVLAENYLHYTPQKIDTLIGKRGVKQKSMRDVPVEDVCEYAAEDADITFQLKEKLEPILKKNKLIKLFAEVELPLVRTLARMEMNGIKIDVNGLAEFSLELAKDIKKIEKSIYTDAGVEFNIASPKQLGDILFRKLELDPKAKKTKSGQFATGEEILSKLAPKHKIVQKILDFRQLVKLKNTYVDTLPTMINPHTGRVHTSFAQAVAATGRLSSNNPNLQNIPIRTQRGREVRKAFIPRNSKYTLLSADYSQIELRLMADFSGDKSMMQAFKDGHDIHAATAAKVYDVDLNDVTSDMRSKAKMVNFGIIYGISAFGLSQRLNIPRKEAKEIIDSYFETYPKVKEYMDGSIESARKHGYVETILKRRRYLRDINSANAVVRGFAERNAINAPLQGSAADLIKVAMNNIHAELEKRDLETAMLLQVHDELVFDVPKNELDEVEELVCSLMENAITLKVPLLVEAGHGKNWLEAH